MSDFRITTMSPEVLAEKFPDVHKAIYDEGYAAGRMRGTTEGERIGRQQAETYNQYITQRAASAQPELTAAEESAKSARYFEMLAKEYAKENKCTIGRAMMACAKLYPVEHQAFIQDTQ